MDGLMVDRLYEELEPAQQQSFDEHRSSCARCAAELASFERTRAAYRELPAAEPPAALSAILLHAAAGRSARRARRVGPGLGVAVRPPPAARRASRGRGLRLAGAGGGGCRDTLRARHGEQVAQPRVATEASAPAAATARVRRSGGVRRWRRRPGGPGGRTRGCQSRAALDRRPAWAER